MMAPAINMQVELVYKVCTYRQNHHDHWPISDFPTFDQEQKTFLLLVILKVSTDVVDSLYH